MVNVKRLAEDTFREFEKKYDEAKAKEAEELHNAIAVVIADRKATIQNTLFVLEMIRFELLRAKYEQLMGHAIVPPGGGVTKDASKLSVGEE